MNFYFVEHIIICSKSLDLTDQLNNRLESDVNQMFKKSRTEKFSCGIIWKSSKDKNGYWKMFNKKRQKLDRHVTIFIPFQMMNELLWSHSIDTLYNIYYIFFRKNELILVENLRINDHSPASSLLCTQIVGRKSKMIQSVFYFKI